jgi:predicted membrane-bound mannosyltransferase
MAKKSERKEALMRILVCIISGIILKVWNVLVVILALVNWLITIISGKRNRELANFCEYWNTEFYKFARYLTAESNVRPFPFSNVERMSKFQ